MEHDNMDEITIGKRITWARDTAGLKIGQAARLLDTTPDRLLAIEQDRISPSPDELKLFEMKYDVDLKWLKTGIERPVDVPMSHHMSEEDREATRRLFARMRQNS
jgi:transcriptional regulator with XRE-family HTH domain